MKMEKQVIILVFRKCRMKVWLHKAVNKAIREVFKKKCPVTQRYRATPFLSYM